MILFPVRLGSRVGAHALKNIAYTITGWWFFATPLKKIRVRQLGWWMTPNISGKMPNMATSHHQPAFIVDICWYMLIYAINSWYMLIYVSNDTLFHIASTIMWFAASKYNHSSAVMQQLASHPIGRIRLSLLRYDLRWKFTERGHGSLHLWAGYITQMRWLLLQTLGEQNIIG